MRRSLRSEACLAPGHCRRVAGWCAEIRCRQGERACERLLRLLLPELVRLEGSHAAVPAVLCGEPRLTAAPRDVLHRGVLVTRVLPAGLAVASMHCGVLLLLLLHPSICRVWILIPGLLLLTAILMLLQVP